MKWIIFFLILSSLLIAEEIVISIDNPDSELSEWINDNNIEVVNKYKIDIIVSETQLNTLKQNGYYCTIVSTEESRLRDIVGYRNYEETTAELQQIASNYPAITQLSSLGNSTCYDYYLAGNSNYSDFQHQVWCLKLSDNPQENEDEPNIFFVGEIHAREPISLEVDMHILNYLVSSYGIIDSVTNWIDSTQIWFVPLMNPDGHKLVTEGWHTMHRKNMRDNNENGLPDYNTYDGVDLNRNFGYVWGNNGASSIYYSNTYHGPYEWSEQETIYLRDLITSHKFFAGVTYHSYGQWVLYPLGHLPGSCSYDHEIMDELAVEMAETIPKITGGGYYTPMQAVDFGYTCQGTMGDWGYAEQRIFAYTIELASNFIPPASQVNQICEDNLQAALIMLDRVNHSTVSGIVSNEDDEPLVVEVNVPIIDDQTGMTSVEPVRSGSTYGRYYRMLLPGTYTFVFEKEGYLPQIFDNIVVTNNGITELDVTLFSEFIQNDRIAIFTDEEFVNLEWTDDGFEHEIYSATTPNGEFLLNENGAFISSNSWQEPLVEKMFYLVKRVQTE